MLMEATPCGVPLGIVGRQTWSRNGRNAQATCANYQGVLRNYDDRRRNAPGRLWSSSAGHRKKLDRVGGCEIHEEIQRSKSDWPDATFLRTYRLKRDGRKLTVGSYENESSTGVTNSPFAVGEYIVIPTSCYVYRVGPDNQVSEFSPWKANEWQSFSEPLGINGHYDYHADKVEEVNGVWRLTYVLESGLDRDRPKFIHFVTKDNWQSFQVETEEHEQAE